MQGEGNPRQLVTAGPPRYSDGRVRDKKHEKHCHPLVMPLALHTATTRWRYRYTRAYRNGAYSCKGVPDG